MRIPPPIIPQSQNFLQSGGLRPAGSAADDVTHGGVLSSQALARASALDAATLRSGPGTSPPAFDADTIAKKILDMVSLQLQNALAHGASKQELGNLLQQARDGAQTGFDAAITQLQDTGELDDALSNGISTALQKVDQGFNTLAEQLGLENARAKMRAVTLGDLASDYSQQFASGQSAELTIKTADGDTVRLHIGIGSAGMGTAVAEGSRQSAGGVTLAVDGDLDADETKALNELVGRVGKLADSFFGGDMHGALRQAEDFAFDNPELSSLSLTLRRSVSVYQDMQSLGSDALTDYAALGNGALESGTAAAAGAGSSVKARLAEQLSAMLPGVSFAVNPANTLKELLAVEVAAKGLEDSPLLDFANRLLDAMGAAAPDNATAAAA
jgi:hypothetical protein